MNRCRLSIHNEDTCIAAAGPRHERPSCPTRPSRFQLECKLGTPPSGRYVSQLLSRKCPPICHVWCVPIILSSIASQIELERVLKCLFDSKCPKIVIWPRPESVPERFDRLRVFQENQERPNYWPVLCVPIILSLIASQIELERVLKCLFDSKCPKIVIWPRPESVPERFDRLRVFQENQERPNYWPVLCVPIILSFIASQIKVEVVPNVSAETKTLRRPKVSQSIRVPRRLTAST